jgi:nucleoside-diphosphate-sugar epimerase
MILVIGGRSKIGSALIADLVARDETVRAVCAQATPRHRFLTLSSALGATSPISIPSARRSRAWIECSCFAVRLRRRCN